MTTTQSESVLSRIVLATWDRARSSQELNSLIRRRELALEMIESNEQ